MSVWRDMINMCKQYLVSVNQDPGNFTELLRAELKSLGIIDGGESMTYKDPDNNYTFKIDRIGNDYVVGDGPEYTCIITILNDVGVRIDEIRFSEYDCVKVLGNIAEYVETVYEFGCLDPFISHLGFSTSRMYNNIEISVSEYSLKPFTLKFEQSNPHLGIMSDICTIFLEYEELVDFCFRIFFQCIIDLDFNCFYKKGLEKEIIYLEGFVIDDSGMYVRNKNGYFDAPREYNNYFSPAETYSNNEIQTPSYTSTSTPQLFHEKEVVMSSDGLFGDLTTPKANKNTVLGLFSSTERKKKL
jgi:hypothetical protein